MLLAREANWMSAGIIDMHVHMTGGGGEAGPPSRCPEAQVRSSAGRLADTALSSANIIH